MKRPLFQTGHHLFNELPGFDGAGFVIANRCPGSAIMQSTRSASMMFFLISPSPD